MVIGGMPGRGHEIMVKAGMAGPDRSWIIMPLGPGRITSSGAMDPELLPEQRAFVDANPGALMVGFTSPTLAHVRGRRPMLRTHSDHVDAPPPARVESAPKS